MSTYGPEWRSYKPIAREDLKRLVQIARADLREFFARYPEHASLYRGRLLGYALCQGAANHFIGRSDGIQDFDVYAFFAAHPRRQWYAKRVAVRDFGDPKFGQSASKPTYVGRRVDLMGRSLSCSPRADIAKAIQQWLLAGKSRSSKLLAKKAVVLLTPARRMGEVVWPVAERAL